MQREAIYHRARDQFAYPNSDGTFHIHLRTKSQDISTVTFVYGDPFEFHENNWVHTTKEMSICGRDGLFDYWFIAIHPPQQRLRYAFHIKNGDEELFFTEKGIYDTVHEDFSAYFCLPYYHRSDVFTAPDWVKNTVWYQIFPDRFANGNIHNDTKGTIPWNSTEPTPTSLFGGDIEGVIEHLDYLVDLGITGIYFTPIFKAHSNHKYDTIDYFEIDPQFGDKKTLKKLVTSCHDKGIKVMLDAVFNHCGKNFPPFQDVLRNGQNSSYKDWFHLSIEESGVIHYETFSFEGAMPKLNTQHPEVKKYLIEVGQYWIKECNIDGWRLDVANEIDHQFWRDFRYAIKSINKDVYLVGEVWHDAMPWLDGDQFDAVMNYPFSNILHRFFCYDELNAKQFSNELQRHLHQYPQPVYHFSFNMVGSHDTPRILNLARMNKQRVKLLSVFQFSFYGSPSIYYGDEIGLSGEQDPGCRGCMVWHVDEQDSEMLSFMKKLIKLRNSYPVLANDGTFSIITADESNNVLCYQRENNKQLVIIIINLSSQKQTLPLPVKLKDRTILDLWNKEEYAAHSNELSVTLNANDFALLLIQ